MINNKEINPNETFPSKNPALLALAEVPFAVIHLRRSIEQRKVDLHFAQAWLNEAVKIGIENNITDIFQKQDESIKIARKIGTGFFTSVFVFETHTGSWVLKIGAEKSPVPGWPDPSNKEYAIRYARNLHILRGTFDDCLPNIIPHPQYVMYPNDRDKSTSLIIQPFISPVENLSKILSKNPDVRKSILNELEIFYAKSESMRQNYGVFPDLGTDGNLVLTQSSGIYHLTLLNNGLIDQEANSPVMKTYNLVRYHRRLHGTIGKLKKSLATGSL